MERYQLLTRNSLSSVVVNYLKEKIITGDFKGGERIVESEIAETLGISRAPVREGIKELASQGLIQSVPRKGNFVVKFSMNDLAEIFEIRLLLENSVFEILLNENKLSAADISKLTEIVDEMVAIAQGNEEQVQKIVRVNEKDIEFHSFLWKKSGSARRMKILQDLHFQLRIAMVIDTKLTGNLEKTAADHYEIVRSLKLKDVEMCKKALKEHILTVEKNLPKKVLKKKA